jgi:hypothetical protein
MRPRRGSRSLLHLASPTFASPSWHSRATRRSYSRYASTRIEWADPWQEPTELVRRLLAFAASQHVPLSESVLIPHALAGPREYKVGRSGADRRCPRYYTVLGVECPTA